MIFFRPFSHIDLHKSYALCFYLQQVQSPIVFPSKIDASDELKACCMKIFVSAKRRPTIAELKLDTWVDTKYKEFDKLASLLQTSTK